MPLRKRLTLINTLLVAGIILLLGAIVYQLISVNLVFQLDKQLQAAAERAVEQIPAAQSGDFTSSDVENILLEDGFYYQFWTRDKRLLRQSGDFQEQTPLNVTGFGLETPQFTREIVEGEPLRVLSVPLMVGKRRLGMMMVGTELTMVEDVQAIILSVLGSGLLLSVVLVALSVWASTYRALEPLDEAAEIALQISKADDLALRIPYSGPCTDEVGQLIGAFNQTLSQMEDLFNTQRQFISDVSHELRTPLTVIKGNLDLLREIECIEHESFQAVIDEVNRLARMVNDLLILAQAESGQLPLEKEQVSLDTLLLEVYQNALMITEDKLEVEITELDQVIIGGDKDRIKQVMLNLVNNAVKYTPTGGKIQLRLWKNEQKAYFAVEDTGPGIPEEDLPHIFKRFYRSEKARTRSKDSGFGLGLAIAHWIVEHHEGEIIVNSRPGVGTTFTVELPLEDSGRV